MKQSLHALSSEDPLLLVAQFFRPMVPMQSQEESFRGFVDSSVLVSRSCGPNSMYKRLSYGVREEEIDPQVNLHFGSSAWLGVNMQGKEGLSWLCPDGAWHSTCFVGS